MIKIFSVALGLLFSQWAYSYGDIGHKAVASIAWQQLTPFAKQNAERILGAGKLKFVEASVWADHIKRDERFNYLKPMHYVNLPKASTKYQRSRDCKKDKCIVEAIKTFSKVAKSGSKKEQRLALRMLIHLVGDIHQPLHAGLKEDRGGNWYEVKYQGKAVSLHKLWDNQLVKRIAKDWESVSAVVEKLNIQAPLYGPKVWAEESHALTTGFAYEALENSSVSQEYLAKADNIIQDQLAKAGWRLAMWLNKLW
jgi:hypothetical protein